MVIALPWIIFAAVVVGLLFFSFTIVKYYTDKHDSEALPTIVSVAGLTVVLLCVFLIPVDIYVISSAKNPADGSFVIDRTELDSRLASVRILYYVLYSCVLGFVFIIIPFSYFFFEEEDENTTFGRKVFGACKYTIFLIIIMIVILVIGLLVKRKDAPNITKDQEKFFKELIDYNAGGGSTITFAVACMATIGYLTWLTYTAYGFSALPIGMIRGTKKLREEKGDLETQISVNREKKRAIESKYLGGKQINSRDKKDLDELEKKERLLNRRNSLLESKVGGCWNRTIVCCTPFTAFFGVFFLLISLLLIVSFALTQIDKIKGSICGASCGYILEYSSINPIDKLLELIAPAFPIDLIVLGGLILYIFLTSLSGIVTIGIRFFWVHLYKIRARATMPQGILATVIILMLSVVALNLQIVLNLAPQYSSFGTQTYVKPNSTDVIPCSPNADPSVCTLSGIATFVNVMSLSFFGVVFYWLNWAFLATYLIGAFVAVFKRKASNIEDHSDDEAD